MAKLTIIISFILLLFSCDRPECKNTNVIFNQFGPEKEEYKKELANQIRSIGTKNLRYWFDKAFSFEGKQYIEVYIQGLELCAKGQLIVGDKAKQTRIGSYGKGGYHRAELKDVEISIQQDSTATNFILEKVGSILD